MSDSEQPTAEQFFKDLDEAIDEDIRENPEDVFPTEKDLLKFENASAYALYRESLIKSLIKTLSDTLSTSVNLPESYVKRMYRFRECWDYSHLEYKYEGVEMNICNRVVSLALFMVEKIRTDGREKELKPLADIIGKCAEFNVRNSYGHLWYKDYGVARIPI